MGEAASVEESTPAFRGVTLPSRLRRPEYREVNKAALAAIDPVLAETNVEYMRDCLEVKGVRYVSIFPFATLFSFHAICLPALLLCSYFSICYGDHVRKECR